MGGAIGSCFLQLGHLCTDLLFKFLYLLVEDLVKRKSCYISPNKITVILTMGGALGSWFLQLSSHL